MARTLPILETITTPNPLVLTPSDTVALFGAHPDDIEVMLAYSAQTAIANGAAVYAYVASDGEASTLGDPTFVRAGQRRIEATQGLQHVGIGSERLHTPGLADGALAENFSVLADDIAGFIAAYGITAAITLGTDGGDGHSDHIAVHRAVVASGNVVVWGLNQQGEGEVVVRGDQAMTQRKLGAIACHSSQFPMVRKINGSPIPHGWLRQANFAMPEVTAAYLGNYTHLLVEETYDRSV